MKAEKMENSKFSVKLTYVAYVGWHKYIFYLVSTFLKKENIIQQLLLVELRTPNYSFKGLTALTSR